MRAGWNPISREIEISSSLKIDLSMTWSGSWLRRAYLCLLVLQQISDLIPLTGGYSEGLDAFIFFFEHTSTVVAAIAK